MNGPAFKGQPPHIGALVHGADGQLRGLAHHGGVRAKTVFCQPQGAQAARLLAHDRRQHQRAGIRARGRQQRFNRREHGGQAALRVAASQAVETVSLDKGLVRREAPLLPLRVVDVHMRVERKRFSGSEIIAQQAVGVRRAVAVERHLRAGIPAELRERLHHGGYVAGRRMRPHGRQRQQFPFRRQACQSNHHGSTSSKL